MTHACAQTDRATRTNSLVFCATFPPSPIQFPSLPSFHSSFFPLLPSFFLSCPPIFLFSIILRLPAFPFPSFSCKNTRLLRNPPVCALTRQRPLEVAWRSRRKFARSRRWNRAQSKRLCCLIASPRPDNELFVSAARLNGPETAQYVSCW